MASQLKATPPSNDDNGRLTEEKWLNTNTPAHLLALLLECLFEEKLRRGPKEGMLYAKSSSTEPEAELWRPVNLLDRWCDETVAWSNCSHLWEENRSSVTAILTSLSSKVWPIVEVSVCETLETDETNWFPV